MVEQNKYVSADAATPAISEPNGGNVDTNVPSLADRDVIRHRLRAELAEAEAETDHRLILAKHFKRQWTWLQRQEGEVTELQLLAPDSPDEARTQELRALNRRDSSKGEYRPANRYARVRSLREAATLLHHAGEQFQHQGLYVLANRLKPAVGDKSKMGVWTTFAGESSGTTDIDFSSRAVLMLDADPHRTDGVKSISATAEERARAIDRCLDIYADVAAVLGSERALAFVSSGNGAQSHIYVDLPNTDAVTGVVRRFLFTLDVLYRTHSVELDTSPFDAKRLFPAGGTWKRKGADNAASGRIHRPTLFLAAVEVPTALSLDQVDALLETFAARLTPEVVARYLAFFPEKSHATLRKELAPPTKTSTATTSPGARDADVWRRCGDINIRSVAEKLGLDSDKPTCPSCGRVQTATAFLDNKGPNILHCSSATCSKGQHDWGPVALVAKVAFGSDDARGNVGKQVLEWFAQHFGVEIPTTRPSRRQGPTLEEVAASRARYSQMLAELAARATQRDPRGRGTEARPNEEVKRANADPSDPRSAAPAPALAQPDAGGASAAAGTAPGGATAGSRPKTASQSQDPDPKVADPATKPRPLTDDEIVERLRVVVGRSALEQETAIQALHRDTDKALGVLRAQLKQLEKELTNDGAADGGDDTTRSLEGILDDIGLVRGSDSRVYGRFGNEYVPVDSGQFHARIAFLFHEASGGYVAAASIDKLMLPKHGGDLPRERVPIRHGAGADGVIWVDLGDRKHFVKITRTAVTVESACPLAFRRPDGMLALPVPELPKDDEECAAALEAYRTSMNVDRARFTAIFCWQVCAMRPMEMPDADAGYTEYPILKITGGEGSGKTMRAESIRAAVDPKEPMLTGAPSKAEDICISGEHGRVLASDNLTYIDQEHSDARCRRSTGDGDERRELFTTRSLAHFVGSNPQLFTSIAEAATEVDLLSRCISLDLERTSKGKTKRMLRAKYRQIAPRVVGALCRCISRALKNVDSVALPEDVRMLDSAQWALAAAEGGGFTRAEIIAVFSGAIERADGIVLDKAVIVTLLEVVRPATTWTGAMGEMLETLTARYERRTPETGKPTRRTPKDWPQTAEGLRARLKKAESTLQRRGIVITWATAGGGARGRGCTITRAPDLDMPDVRRSATGCDVMVEDDDEDWERILDSAVEPNVRVDAVRSTQLSHFESRTAVPTATENVLADPTLCAGVAVDAVISSLQRLENKEGVEPRKTTGYEQCISLSDNAEGGTTVSTATTAQVADLIGSYDRRSAVRSLVGRTGPSRSTARARAVWATYEAGVLTLALHLEPDAPTADPTTFDIRTLAPDEVPAALASYGWSGLRDGTVFIEFAGDVSVVTEETLFTDGSGHLVVAAPGAPVEAAQDSVASTLVDSAVTGTHDMDARELDAPVERAEGWRGLGETLKDAEARKTFEELDREWEAYMLKAV